MPEYKTVGGYINPDPYAKDVLTESDEDDFLSQEESARWWPMPQEWHEAMRKAALPKNPRFKNARHNG